MIAITQPAIHFPCAAYGYIKKVARYDKELLITTNTMVIPWSQHIPTFIYNTTHNFGDIQFVEWEGQLLGVEDKLQSTQ